MTDNVETIVRVAQEATEPSELALGSFYVVTTPAGVQRVDLTGDEYRDAPRRKTGTVRVRDVPSFAEYHDKHAVAGVTEVYADRDACTVTAVLDAHEHAGGAPGWRGHRLTLALKFSEAFAAWRLRDGALLGQEDFAEFLDDQRADILQPSAAEMLEVAQTIQGTSKVDWQAGFRIVDGQRRVGFVETNQATAGQKGELAIPTQITIGVPIFDGSAQAHALTARFRHRIEGGKLRLSYKLDRPNDVITAAFDGAMTELGEACGACVLRGTPA